MSERHHLRRGYCPGAHAPMQSGDGLMIRVRAGARALSAAALRTVAHVARRQGNGIVEVTRRGNLQLRGLRPDTTAPAQAELVAAGLVHADPAVERRLALLVSPWSEIDESLARLALTLERTLAELSLELPAKFGAVLDDAHGALSDVEGDVRLELSGARVRVRIGGTHGSARTLGACRSEHAAQVLAQLARELTFSGERRMRDLQDLTALRVACAPWLEDAAPPSSAPPHGQLGFVDHLGLFLGVPFGAAPADTWDELAALAERFGDGRLRTTSARGVLLCAVPGPSEELLERVRALSCFVSVDDARARLAACSGAPACSAAHGETRALALSLAAHLPGFARLHVSGCPKSCAHGGASDVTLVHGPSGAHLGFDLDAARTVELPTVPLAELPVRIAAHFETSP